MRKNKFFKIQVGIVGTGYIARGLAKLLYGRADMEISYILSRRNSPIDDLGVPQDLVTNSITELLENSDIIVVSTGDPIYSTAVIDLAFLHGKKVVTMDADTHVVSGSWLSQRGHITEAEGDQPGCLAALREDVIEMGFTPLVYGNIKGYLNTNPSYADMVYWAEKQGFSVNSVTSFTDGTKLQIEQCMVANAFGASIAQRGLLGVREDDLKIGAFKLADVSLKNNTILSDYIISPVAPPGVFIAATHQEDVRGGLKTYKMGDGPVYLHYKPVHLCYFEIPKTIKKFFYSNKITLNNGKSPKVSVAAIAKKRINAGVFIEKGIGSIELRGEAMLISELPDHVPIGLMRKARIKRSIEPGQILTFDDVELPDSLAYTAWQETFFKRKLSTINII